MKAIALLLLLAAAASGATNATLVTRDGQEYRNPHVRRVMGDGLLVAFEPEPGSQGIANIKRARLPDAWIKEFGKQMDSKITPAPEPTPGRSWDETVEELQKPMREKNKREFDAVVQKREWETIVEMVKREAEAKAAEEKKKKDEEQRIIAEAARRKQAADEAAFQRWQIQDNQLDSIDKGIKNLNQNLDEIDWQLRTKRRF
jgi:hypothetical protein